MSNIFVIRNKIKIFKNKKISVTGDKSLSIRWVLFSSIANGKSRAYNLLKSEDVLAALKVIRSFGIKVNTKKKYCEITGKGPSGYRIKKNHIIDAQNSGTLGRLILGLLIDKQYKIKLIGDQSLSKRDFKRITDPLTKFGCKYKLRSKKYLPIEIYGTKKPKPIKYFENKGSAQCKSSVLLAGLKTDGLTKIKAKKSRNHTELLCQHLGLPVEISRKKNYDFINVKKVDRIKPLNYKIPSDISSASFFIVLSCLTEYSSITIRNVNINPSRLGLIKILRLMNAKIFIKNKKEYKGELIGDVTVKGTKKFKSINCPKNLNSGAIDEFMLIFLVAAKSEGISKFNDLEELNHKESPRLKWGAKILNNMGIKTILTKKSIQIYGNPGLSLSNKEIVIKNYLKDHRVFMTSVIAGLVFGGNWKIHDKDSINTSFPNFLKLIKKLQE